MHTHARTLTDAYTHAHLCLSRADVSKLNDLTHTQTHAHTPLPNYCALVLCFSGSWFDFGVSYDSGVLNYNFKGGLYTSR